MHAHSVYIFLLMILSAFALVGQTKGERNEYTFMFYNTENFFDCENDSLTADDEFTPDGNRRWTPSRYNDKTNRIAKVVLAAGKWNAPVIVGLCEIENRQVLEKLTKSPALAAFHYKIVHKDSPDERGIDVALIYRPEFFRPFDYQAIPVIDPDDPNFKTRDILSVSGILNNCDTVCLFVNHWPSKYGGVMETRRLRNLAASTLRVAVDEISGRMRSAKIICMGDFNDTPEDESLKNVLRAEPADSNVLPGKLINLSYSWINEPVQTIKNQYSWQTFDQWIVSENFVTDTTGCRFLKAEIFQPGFLLEADKKFGGTKPYRTYSGFKYQDGFSDHLPVLLRIQLPAK